MHQSSLIRHAITAALLNETAAAGRVFPTRIVPFRKVELPAIAVYSGDETTDPDSVNSAPRIYRITQMFHIEVAVSLKTNDVTVVEDALDALRLEVQKILAVDETFSGSCAESFYARGRPEYEAMQDFILGVFTLDYSVEYDMDAPFGADTAVVDYLRSQFNYSLSNQVIVANQAVDEIELEQ